MRHIVVIFCQLAFRAILALIMGYSFSAQLMRGLVPTAWALPGTLMGGVACFLLLAWFQQPASPVPASVERPHHDGCDPLLARDRQHVFRGNRGKQGRRTLGSSSRSKFLRSAPSQSLPAPTRKVSGPCRCTGYELT